MMNIHSTYDNMHKNVIIYDLKCTNNHVILSINYMLSPIHRNAIEGSAIAIDLLWVVL